MTGGHHSRGAVERRTEVVRIAKLGFAGRDAHPHRQFQFPLRGNSSLHRRLRRGERRTHAVTGVLEQIAAVRPDRCAKNLVMRGQRGSHGLRIGFPPTCRTFHVGEKKRHNPRRRDRGVRGHPWRIPQRGGGRNDIEQSVGLASVSIGRKEAVAVSVGVLLVVAAFVVPHLHLGIVTPLINMTPADLKAFADAAPIFGWWNAHVGWGTVPAILIGAAAVLWGPRSPSGCRGAR